MHRLAALAARARRIDPWRLDVAIGLVVAVEGQLELTLTSATGGDLLAARVVVALLGAGLILRRRAPVVSALVVFACYFATSQLDASISESLLLPFFALFVSVYSLGRYVAGWRLAVAALAVLGVAETAVLVDDYDDDVGNLVFTALVLVGAPIMVGRAVAQRAELSRTLRVRAEQLERERSDRAEAAVLEERTRIAGELHDVIAHALGAMVVQASAAHRLAERDPARAGEAFAAIEATGRDALTEMRALLGVLRREDDGIALDPQPSLTHLSTLVRRASAAGLPVELAVEGERRAVPAGVDLVAYRVVQEALGRALDGGSAGRAVVRVRYDADAVEVTVDDDGGDARGLPGVRERVALYGGELLAGRRREGGHTVRVRLPLAGAPA
ncbi:MAG TPA: histidine kinase [Capillimicrobium sp.]|nr:histidine kinase [Capillimicrobium sp.]